MPAATIHIYAAGDSPRLRYVLDWLLGEQYDLAYTLSTPAPESGKGISYGRAVPGCIHIPDAGGLLWADTIRPVAIATGEWEGLPVLFKEEDGDNGLPFDLFSAVFYLLSRYEEYLPFTPDRHGRYPATDSILFKQGWLERPVVDEWVDKFRLLLGRYLGFELGAGSSFSFQPTYDIDIAWSYRHKGWKRWAGSLLREAAGGNWRSALQRLQVSLGAPDPYDAYAWLQELHTSHGLKPYYFILAAHTTTDWDKNILPGHPAMRALIRQMGVAGIIGMHPSYYSDKSPSVLQAEQSGLAAIAGKEIIHSRQHFIRLLFPHTYRALLAAGITEDYSMGYSTHLGFRAGTARSFPWYDTDAGNRNGLRIRPFCFMDTTAHYDLGLAAAVAFERLSAMKDRLQKINSPLWTVFHNFSLGTDLQWQGWRQAYAAFIAGLP